MPRILLEGPMAPNMAPVAPNIVPVDHHITTVAPNIAPRGSSILLLIYKVSASPPPSRTDQKWAIRVGGVKFEKIFIPFFRGFGF